MNRHRTHFIACALAACTLAAGCRDIDTGYGHASGQSINGTGVFAGLLEGRGHKVGVSHRLHHELDTDTLVRFSPFPDQPPDDETEWYNNWLTEGYGRTLVYVLNGFDTEREFWTTVRAALPADANPETISRLDWKISQSRDQSNFWKPGGATPASEEFRVMPLFRLDPSGQAASGDELGGEWAEEYELGPAKFPLARPLIENPVSYPLLTKGGKIAVAEIERGNGRVLVVANGSFLLNEGLVHRDRRPLASLVADWIGPDGRKIVFIEGPFPLLDLPNSNLFRLLFVDPLTYVIPHLILLGILAVAARAVRLGRPRAERITNAERPAAHAEALGDLMSRGRDERDARAQVVHYRQWRSKPSATPLRGKRYRR